MSGDPVSTSVPSTLLLGLPIHRQAGPILLDYLGRLMQGEKPSQVITANPLLLLEAELRPELKDVCRKASLVVSDSAGLTLAAILRRQPVPPRTPGIDLAYSLCQKADQKKLPVFLLGGEPGVSQRAAAFLSQRFPALSIGGIRDGFFKEEESDSIIQEIRQSGSRLILVALGMPKQELWISRRLASLPAGLYIGVGGTFDIWSGALKRAPKWVRSLGLEWLYRLLQEPFRWRRMIQLPVFLVKAVFFDRS